MNNRTKELSLAAILTALSILITCYMPKLPFPPPFSLTLGSHVPTILAMFISPWVVVMTVIGSCIGFAMTFAGTPSAIIVVARAAMHLIFSLIGLAMLNKGKIHILLILLITAFIHAVSECVVVFTMTPLILPDSAVVASSALALAGTFVHHIMDFAIALPIATALRRAKIIYTPVRF